MEKTLINNWNNTVTNKDMVYILGDFIWSKSTDIWIEILNKLNGNKCLIKGNHDPKKIHSKVRNKFCDIKDYKEIKDGDKRIIMSHYPILFYKKAYDDNTIMLHGHVHERTIEANVLTDTIKDIYLDDKKYAINKANIFNVGCMLNDYTPINIEYILKKISERKLQILGEYYENKNKEN